VLVHVSCGAARIGRGGEARGGDREVAAIVAGETPVELAVVVLIASLAPLSSGVRLLSGRNGPSFAGTKLSVRWPFGVWPAVLCASSLRRSGEMAL
jgi:hypothetical protein